MNTALVAHREAMERLGGMLDKQRTALAALLPPGMSPDHMIYLCRSACARTPSLLECDGKSIVRVVLAGAELGLEVGGVIGEAYIVPFWNNRARQKEAQLIVGYKGMVKLALQHPKVAAIDADVIRAGDEWRETRGTSPALVHVPMRTGQERPVVAAYAVLHLVAGPPIFRVLERYELDATRDEALSKMKDFARASSPWSKYEAEMQRKTALRALCKAIPLSEGLKRAMEIDGQPLRGGELESSGNLERMREKLRESIDVEGDGEDDSDA